MLKEFFVRKLVESKMKDVPKEQRDMVVALIEKNPDFFAKLAQEIQVEIQGGADQMTATMNVMKRHETEIRSIANM